MRMCILQLKAYKQTNRETKHFLIRSICVFEQILYKEQLTESQLKSKNKNRKTY